MSGLLEDDMATAAVAGYPTKEDHVLHGSFEMEPSGHPPLDTSAARGAAAPGRVPGTATRAQVAVNIFISFVGAGLLGLPYAFSRSGWLLGTACLGVVSAGNVYAMLLLVRCRKQLESEGRTGIQGYGDLGREVLGARGEALVNVCLVLSQVGFATAYLIFIAANVHSVTCGRVDRALVIYACVPVLSGA